MASKNTKFRNRIAARNAEQRMTDHQLQADIRQTRAQQAFLSDAGAVKLDGVNRNRFAWDSARGYHETKMVLRTERFELTGPSSKNLVAIVKTHVEKRGKK